MVPRPAARRGEPVRRPHTPTGMATRGCYKPCMSGWTDPDLTMPEVRPPKCLHGIRCSKSYDRHEKIEQMCEVSDFESGIMSGWIGVAMGLVSPNLTCIFIRYQNYLYFLPKNLIFVIFCGFS